MAKVKIKSIHERNYVLTLSEKEAKHIRSIIGRLTDSGNMSVFIGDEDKPSNDAIFEALSVFDELTPKMSGFRPLVNQKVY